MLYAGRHRLLVCCDKMNRWKLLRVCTVPVCRALHSTSFVLGQLKQNLSKLKKKPTRKSLLLQRHECLVKNRRQKQHVYLLDQDIADNVAQIISNQQTNKSSVILEHGSGPGILSKALLDHTSGKVVCLDHEGEFYPYLQYLSLSYPDRVIVSQWDPFASLFRHLPNNVVSDYFEKESVVMSQIPHKDWTKDPPLTVVGSVLPNRWYQTLSYLLKNMATKEGVYSAGRVEWFLFVPSKGFRWHWNSVNNRSIGNYYSIQGIMLQVFFDIKHHLTLPAGAFSPPFPGEKISERSLRTMMIKKNDAHLLQFTPKADAYLKGDDIIRFQSFIYQLLTRNKNHRLIPRMEHWIPGVGIPLINIGCTMMQKMRDLVPDQLLQIYMEVVKLPEFENSGLHELLEESVSHLHITSADEPHSELDEKVMDFDRTLEEAEHEVDKNVFNIDHTPEYLKYELDEDQESDMIDYPDIQSDEPEGEKT